MGRNVLHGRWTFQIVEDFDDRYWQPFREFDADVRRKLLDGRRHVYEAELKEQRRTHGRARHESRPAPDASSASAAGRGVQHRVPTPAQARGAAD